MKVQRFYFNALIIILHLAVCNPGMATHEWQTSQDVNDSTLRILIVRATSTVTIDGEISEQAWKTADVANGFYLNYPYDTSFALSATDVRLTYNDQFLYIAAICYDTLEGDYVIPSLKRDYPLLSSDAFAILIDPFNDKTNGFFFSISPFGVQSEGLISNSGMWGSSNTWDNKWYSEVKRYNDRWEAEIAIPFKTLRFKEGIDEWRINFSRNDMKRNERSSWVPVPRNFNTTTLFYTGAMVWDTLPVKTGKNISVIPYAIGGLNRNFLDTSALKTTGSIGLDAKVAITSALNMDLTVNPDYSQVEVDEQVTNLSRFEIFFPEKRTFFLENSDLFDEFGFRNIRPFFSRRIGLSLNEVTGNYIKTPIIGGVRLSGRIDKNWRIGVMDMQTMRENSLVNTAQNYAVAAVQRQVMGNSNISAIFVNRQSMSSDSSDNIAVSPNNFNRIAGADFNFTSKNNKWKSKIFYHHSFTSKNLPDAGANASYLVYRTRTIFAMWNHEYVGENFNADVGFVPRKGYWRLEPKIDYNFFPKSGFVYTLQPGISSDIYFNKAGRFTDRLIKLKFDITFLNTSKTAIDFKNDYIRLLRPYDPSKSGGDTLPSGSEYNYNSVVFEYYSDKRKKFSIDFNFETGSYFNGNKTSAWGEFNYRVQPWGVFSVKYALHDIRLPAPYSNTKLVLIGPKVEFSFTRSIFFTTFFQYNSQIDNFNINARFQWRFRPMSDFFLVYTDNYETPGLYMKERAVVVKFVYWL